MVVKCRSINPLGVALAGSSFDYSAMAPMAINASVRCPRRCTPSHTNIGSQFDLWHRINSYPVQFWKAYRTCLSKL
jgi:hypothetical protein